MGDVPANSAGIGHGIAPNGLDRRRGSEGRHHSATSCRPELVGSGAMIVRTLAFASMLVAATASAQGYQPYPYPPPPEPGYPQPVPGYPQPGYPGVQGPVLAIPVLEQDLKLKAGSNIVRFGRDSYVLT